MGEGYPILAIFGDTGLLFAYKQWVSLIVLANDSASTSWPIVFNGILKQVGSRNSNQASSLGEAFEASTTQVQVHITSKANGSLTYNVIGIGK